MAVVPQFHQHPVAPEQLHQSAQLAGRGGGAFVHQCRRHRALPAPGEHPPVPGHGIGDVVQPEHRHALLPREVPEAERASETGVAGGAVGEHHEVLAVRVGRMRVGQEAGGHLALGVGLTASPATTRTREARGERDLGAEHGGQPHRPCRLGEADDAVEAVVVGEGQSLQTQTMGFLHQLLGVRRAVEEGEVAVAVQLRVRHAHHIGPHERLGGIRVVERISGRFVGLSFATPCGSVATRVPRRRPRGAPIAPALRRGLPGQKALDLRPWHARVVEAHR